MPCLLHEIVRLGREWAMQSVFLLYDAATCGHSTGICYAMLRGACVYVPVSIFGRTSNIDLDCRVSCRWPASRARVTPAAAKSLHFSPDYSLDSLVTRLNLHDNLPVDASEVATIRKILRTCDVDPAGCRLPIFKFKDMS